MINQRQQSGRDQTCCQNRYHQCCEHVTDIKVQDPIPTQPATPKPTTVRPSTPRSVCPKTTPSNLSKFKLRIFYRKFLSHKVFVPVKNICILISQTTKLL